MQSRITGCRVSLAVVLFCLSMLVTVTVIKYSQLRSLFEMQSFMYKYRTTLHESIVGTIVITLSCPSLLTLSPCPVVLL